MSATKQETRKTLSGKRIPAITEPTPFQLAILAGLNKTGRHIYGGTASTKAVASRRATSKVARQSRRANRGR